MLKTKSVYVTYFAIFVVTKWLNLVFLTGLYASIYMVVRVAFALKLFMS